MEKKEKNNNVQELLNDVLTMKGYHLNCPNPDTYEVINVGINNGQYQLSISTYNLCGGNFYNLLLNIPSDDLMDATVIAEYKEYRIDQATQEVTNEVINERSDTFEIKM